jgi:hypothetical protein
LRERYGELILSEDEFEWLFLKAGGVVCVLHASLSEYVLIYGTEISGNGNSNRLWADISVTVLTGAMRKWNATTLRVETIAVGMRTTLYAFDAGFVENPAGTWRVEYGRGFMPAMFADIISSVDPMCLLRTLRIFGNCFLHGMTRQLNAIKTTFVRILCSEY